MNKVGKKKKKKMMSLNKYLKEYSKTLNPKITENIPSILNENLIKEPLTLFIICKIY